MRKYARAKRILNEKVTILHALADALVQRESLDGAEVEMIVKGKTLADIDEERKKRADLLKIQNDEAAREQAATEEQEKNTANSDMLTKPVRA